MSVCPICNKKFTKRVHNQKYCSNECCRKAFRPNCKPLPEKQKLNIDELVRECEIYNKLHGTKYTYGKFKVLKQMGKV